MNIFKHVCLEDGVSVSYFVQNTHDCDQHEHVEPACCHKPLEKEKDCCTDIVEYFKVDLDYYESIEGLNFDFIPAAPASIFKFERVLIVCEPAKVSHLYDDPPFHSPKVLRIQKQVFIV